MGEAERIFPRFDIRTMNEPSVRLDWLAARGSYLAVSEMIARIPDRILPSSLWNTSAGESAKVPLTDILITDRIESLHGVLNKFARSV
jgi:hypothetical protein